MGNFKPTRIARTSAEPLSDALQLFIKMNGLGEGLYRQAVFEAWDKVSNVGRYTTDKYLRNGVLTVTISSSVVRSTIMFQTEFFRDLINNELDHNELLSASGKESVEHIKQIKLR